MRGAPLDCRCWGTFGVQGRLATGVDSTGASDGTALGCVRFIGAGASYSRRNKLHFNRKINAFVNSTCLSPEREPEDTKAFPPLKPSTTNVAGARLWRAWWVDPTESFRP